MPLLDTDGVLHNEDLLLPPPPRRLDEVSPPQPPSVSDAVIVGSWEGAFADDLTDDMRFIYQELLRGPERLPQARGRIRRGPAPFVLSLPDLPRSPPSG